MIRYIKLANDKKRDAEITFRSLNPKPAITMVMESGDKVINKRVVKGTSQTSTKNLLANYFTQYSRFASLNRKKSLRKCTQALKVM